MEKTLLWQLPRELLDIWHSHRLEILLSAAALLVLAQLALALRKKRSKTSLTPPLTSPAHEVRDEKRLVSLSKQNFSEKAVIQENNQFEDVQKTLNRPVHLKLGPKRVTGSRQAGKASRLDTLFDASTDQIQPVIFYWSLGGSTEKIAKDLAQDFGIFRATKQGIRPLKPLLLDLTQIEYDDYFVTPPKPSGSAAAGPKYFYLLLLPTYNVDTELSNFLSHLSETHNDFRIDTAPLSGLLGYSVFGFGDREGWPTEEEGFCSQAREVDKWMARLTGRKRAFPFGTGDVKGDLKRQLQEWSAGVEEVLQDLAAGKGLGEGVAGSGDAVESDEEEDLEGDSDRENATASTPSAKTMRSNRTDDVEDLGAQALSNSPDDPIDFTTYKKRSSAPAPAEAKEMVPTTSPTYTALTKQGYTIVGSHSGVKICRWTKSALRGRGSCYKFSFYGIASHLCMETTPSLSCSNKCVFCWRHGTNPVGTTWRWKIDPPELIFNGVKEGHYKKIKMMRGVPGVRAERFQEAMKIRHCALSLVGEPIFYPHINELLAMLHREHISSFLVCNAQHPEQLAALGPVTQLYVSIDASNKESLRKIDRPLHRDFWERFIRCLNILREKRDTHRTVFRLTLVKGFNIDEEAEGYAELVERALPSFVEIKGVTYCGTSTSSAAGLTMRNVPFYEEVTAFVAALNSALKRRGLEYGIAAEHAHSCCVLIADKKRFLKTDGWHTLIDYEKFFECLESGNPFGPGDYVGAPTPEWALWGRGGFDPRDERVDRKGKKKEVYEVQGSTEKVA
ncbi:hypothetical protein LTR28_003510 [Elasticomyces elasticus]|nr:hypothetical protein LTR28_003510 [Elasticomyces elasticus]